MNEQLTRTIDLLGALHFETGGVLLTQIIALENALKAERARREALLRRCSAR